MKTTTSNNIESKNQVFNRKQAQANAAKLVGKTIRWHDVRKDGHPDMLHRYTVEGVGECGGHTICLYTTTEERESHDLWLGFEAVATLANGETISKGMEYSQRTVCIEKAAAVAVETPAPAARVESEAAAVVSGEPLAGWAESVTAPADLDTDVSAWLEAVGWGRDAADIRDGVTFRNILEAVSTDPATGRTVADTGKLNSLTRPLHMDTLLRDLLIDAAEATGEAAL